MGFERAFNQGGEEDKRLPLEDAQNLANKIKIKAELNATDRTLFGDNVELKAEDYENALHDLEELQKEAEKQDSPIGRNILRVKNILKVCPNFLDNLANNSNDNESIIVAIKDAIVLAKKEYSDEAKKIKNRSGSNDLKIIQELADEDAEEQLKGKQET